MAASPDIRQIKWKGGLFQESPSLTGHIIQLTSPVCDGVGMGEDVGVGKGVWKQGWGSVQACMFRLPRTDASIKLPYGKWKYGT